MERVRERGVRMREGCKDEREGAEDRDRERVG